MEWCDEFRSCNLRVKKIEKKSLLEEDHHFFNNKLVESKTKKILTEILHRFGLVTIVTFKIIIRSIIIDITET